MSDPSRSLKEFAPRYAAYLTEAKRLREKYRDQLHILIGFEGEWIRKDDYQPLIKQLLDGTYGQEEPDSQATTQQERAQRPAVDYFIGSVHHVHGIPIDYDRAMYDEAIAKSITKKKTEMTGSSEACSSNASTAVNERLLFADYYDLQYELLTTLRPQIVGHFDLIRLLSCYSPSSPKIKDVWPEVWEKMMRNLEFIVSYGGWLECNTSALRKGLNEPYPTKEIAQEYVKLGGKFTVGDDSHGIDHVAACYVPALEFLEGLGVENVWTLERVEEGKGGLQQRQVSLASFGASLKR